jgi:hypothetical protein
MFFRGQKKSPGDKESIVGLVVIYELEKHGKFVEVNLADLSLV